MDSTQPLKFVDIIFNKFLEYEKFFCKTYKFEYYSKVSTSPKTKEQIGSNCVQLNKKKKKQQLYETFFQNKRKYEELGTCNRWNGNVNGLVPAMGSDR